MLVLRPLPPDALERFWSLVDQRGPDECWPWTKRPQASGYGRFSWYEPRWGPLQETTHRLVAYITTGEQPNGRWALHSCDNPPCCNPKHLRWGTPRENVDDKIKRGRTTKGARRINGLWVLPVSA